MKSISINTFLSADNAWTRRLFGLESFSVQRTLEKVDAEYEQDKYKKLLSRDFTALEKVKESEFADSGLTQDSTHVISYGDELFETTLFGARQQERALITSVVERHGSTPLCELGCGYGYNLSFFPGFETYGGDYSLSAVELGRQFGFDLQPFNYYNDADYDFLRPGSTVLTCHSMEQLPDASSFLASMRKRKHLIKRVIHLEPTHVSSRSTLLGLMRNRYIDLNDYNRNLIVLLQQARDVEILALSYDLFGMNPLNSSNMIVWEFK